MERHEHSTGNKAVFPLDAFPDEYIYLATTGYDGIFGAQGVSEQKEAA